MYGSHDRGDALDARVFSFPFFFFADVLGMAVVSVLAICSLALLFLSHCIFYRPVRCPPYILVYWRRLMNANHALSEVCEKVLRVADCCWETACLVSAM